MCSESTGAFLPPTPLPHPPLKRMRLNNNEEEMTTARSYVLKTEEKNKKTKTEEHKRNGKKKPHLRLDMIYD